jgi:hypothetical protein
MSLDTSQTDEEYRKAHKLSHYSLIRRPKLRLGKLGHGLSLAFVDLLRDFGAVEDVVLDFCFRHFRLRRASSMSFSSLRRLSLSCSRRDTSTTIVQSSSEAESGNIDFRRFGLRSTESVLVRGRFGLAGLSTIVQSSPESKHIGIGHFEGLTTKPLFAGVGCFWLVGFEKSDSICCTMSARNSSSSISVEHERERLRNTRTSASTVGRTEDLAELFERGDGMLTFFREAGANE